LSGASRGKKRGERGGGKKKTGVISQEPMSVKGEKTRGFKARKAKKVGTVILGIKKRYGGEGVNRGKRGARLVDVTPCEEAAH